MTDLPPPPPGFGAAPDAPSTVVIDTNATVKRSHVGLIVGALVVVALAAFSVVWFATRESDTYEPKAEAQAVLAGLVEAEITVEFSNDELRCIDDAFGGVDLGDLEGAYDPFGGEMSEDVTDRTGTMLECIERPTRIELIADSMTASDLGTPEQMACAADKFDTLVLDNGGYVQVITDEVDISDATLNVFAECGIDLFATGGDDGSAGSPCEIELRTVETAIEAYYATNGVDPTSYDDLVPDYLVEDPSERFQFVAGEGGGVPSVIGIGECEGY